MRITKDEIKKISDKYFNEKIKIILQCNYSLWNQVEDANEMKVNESNLKSQITKYMKSHSFYYDFKKAELYVDDKYLKTYQIEDNDEAVWLSNFLKKEYPKINVWVEFIKY